MSEAPAKAGTGSQQFGMELGKLQGVTEGQGKGKLQLNSWKWVVNSHIGHRWYSAVGFIREFAHCPFCDKIFCYEYIFHLP